MRATSRISVSRAAGLIQRTARISRRLILSGALVIAVRPQYSWSEGGINPLGNGIDRMLLHPLGLSFEGIAGQETFTGDMAERYQRIERHHHVIDTPPRNLV
jgi:hypothetical protein